MENNPSERKVIINGTPNLSFMPTDILEMIAVSLEINIVHAVSEDNVQEQTVKLKNRNQTLAKQKIV